MVFVAAVFWIGGPLGFLPLGLIAIYLVMSAMTIPKSRALQRRVSASRTQRSNFLIEMVHKHNVIRDNAAEQVTLGFSTGDEGIPEAYFYATAYPLPFDLPETDLPEPSRWTTEEEGYAGGILLYDDALATGDAAAAIFAFLCAFQNAAAESMR